MNIIDKTIQDIITEDKHGFELAVSPATGTMYSESFLKEAMTQIARKTWYEAGYKHLQVDMKVCEAWLNKDVPPSDQG